MSQTRRSTTLF